MFTERYILDHLDAPYLKIENENDIFCYEKVNLEEIIYDYIDLFDKNGNFIKKEKFEISSKIAANQEIFKSSFISRKILFNYKVYNLYYKEAISNIGQLSSFGRMLEKLFDQKVFMCDTDKILNFYEILIGNENRFGNEYVYQGKKFIKGIKFLYCPITIGATQTLLHRVRVEDVLNFDYNKVDKFQEQGYNSMNTAIKFFTFMFWGLNEKQMSNNNFDKNSALINKFMRNINDNKIENKLDFCKIY